MISNDQVGEKGDGDNQEENHIKAHTSHTSHTYTHIAHHTHTKTTWTKRNDSQLIGISKKIMNLEIKKKDCSQSRWGYFMDCVRSVYICLWLKVHEINIHILELGLGWPKKQHEIEIRLVLTLNRDCDIFDDPEWILWHWLSVASIRMTLPETNSVRQAPTGRAYKQVWRIPWSCRKSYWALSWMVVPVLGIS